MAKQEFKRDAVRLMRNRGERTVGQIADDLGVGTNQLPRWAAQYEQEAVAKRNEKGETLEEPAVAQRERAAADGESHPKKRSVAARLLFDQKLSSR